MDAERSPATKPTKRSKRSKRSTDPLLLAVVAVAAITPFLQYMTSNTFEALDETSVLLVGAAFAALATLVAALVARRVGPVPASVGAVAFLFLFFVFGPFEQRLGGPLALLMWGVLTAAIVVLTARVAGRTSKARPFLLFLGAALALLGVVPLVLPDSSSASTTAATNLEPFVTEAAGDDPPDVYFFLLDAYARQDQLEAKLHYDNSATIDGLRDRGFDVADDATSSYLFTPASVSSLLSADYPIQSADDLRQGLERFGPVMTGDNRTAATFRALGYEYWYAEPGVFAPMACRPSTGMRCLPVDAARPALGDAGVLIGGSTPLGVLDAFDPPQDLPDPLDVTEQVLASPIAGPRFVHAHILSPHNPFRVHADCSPLDEPIDLLDARKGALGVAYAEQLTCLNTKLTQALDEIIAADPDAIIAVVSDHGDWFTDDFPGPDADPDVLMERFGTLMALRTPGCPDTQAPNLLTDLFPTIFSCISGQDVPLPEQRRFYVDYAGGFGELDEHLRPVR